MRPPGVLQPGLLAHRAATGIPAGPVRGRRRHSAVLHVDRLDEQPAELHGFGPVTAEVARRIAAGGTWRRLLTDPASGSLLDYGTTRYRPPADLTDFVIARDRTCVFATCDVAAEAADIDHTVPAARGGSTSVGNNGPLHRRHHVDKTHHGWRLSQPRPGHYLWISPAHHHYEVEPEPLGVVIEAAIAGYHGSARAAPDPPPF